MLESTLYSSRFTFERATDWHTLVFVNGRFDATLSSTAALPDGVTLLPLARAYDELPLVVEQYLGKVAAYEGQTFTALNTAFLDDGAVLHTGAEVEVARPIHLLFVADASARDGAAQPHNLIVLDRFAKATVIETYAGLGDGSYFTNAVTEAVVGDGATLTHLKLQREGSDAFHVGTLGLTDGHGGPEGPVLPAHPLNPLRQDLDEAAVIVDHGDADHLHRL